MAEIFRAVLRPGLELCQARFHSFEVGFLFLCVSIGAKRQRNQRLREMVGGHTGGVARHQYHFEAAIGGALESCHQGGSFGLPAVKFLRDFEFAGKIALPEVERFYFACVLPHQLAALQIFAQPVSRLVAVFRIFGHEPCHDVGDDFRDLVVQLVYSGRYPRNVGMHQFYTIGGLKWQPPGEHLVQGNTERVKIGAVIHHAIHAAGLFGRKVCQRTFEPVGVAGVPGLEVYSR